LIEIILSLKDISLQLHRFMALSPI